MQKQNTEALRKSIPLNLTHHYARTGKVLTTTVATPRTGQRKLASTFTRYIVYRTLLGKV